MDWTLIKEFIRAELLVLIPVLYLIGIAIKSAAWVKDKHIPLILGALGILLCLLYLAATSELPTWQDMMMFVFAGITQGVLTAGGSVYINQIFKQERKDE